MAKIDKKLLLTLFVFCALIYAEGRKTSRSRSSSSGRGTSRRTSSNPQPAPTSFSYPQSAQKPSLSGWQQQPAQKSVSTWQAKTQTGQSHSYPSSQTGLSGSKSQPSAPNQESIQRSHAQQSQSSNQAGHSYPSSNGLSGGSGAAGYPQGSGLSGSAAGRPGSAGYPQQSSVANPVGSGVGYPQGSGLSGPGAAYPASSGSGFSHGQQGNSYSSGGAPPPYPGNNKPYNGGNYPSNNYGNNYHHPPPPPPYTNHGQNYGGNGGYGHYNPGPQNPGYFGNYGSGFGGVSRTSSALKGVGIAGAGVGTLLTGLALWNMARSTGRSHHTVIYDNRGQPVAVAPANNTEPVEDSFLKDLVNCSLTISSENATEVLAIPCAIASSFSPDADVKDVVSADGKPDNTKCIVSVVTTSGKEYTTTIPCATLLNTAAENNVTEPSLTMNGTDIVNGTIDNTSGTTLNDNQPSASRFSSNEPDMNTSTSGFNNCTSEPGDVRDPINPCFAVTSDLTVIPLQTTKTPNEGVKETNK